MTHFQNKEHTDWRSFLHSWPVLLLLVTFIVFFALRVFHLSKKAAEARQNKRAVMETIEELRAQEAVLQEDISRLKTEEGIEQNIREKFRVVKEGEDVVVIIDKPEEPERKEKRSFFGRLFGGE